MDMDSFEKLAPFAVRSRAVVTGRQNLLRKAKRLAFVLVTTDISENSRREILKAHRCPVYQALVCEDVARLFAFRNTKVLGFLRNPVSAALRKALDGMCMQEEKREKAHRPRRRGKEMPE